MDPNKNLCLLDLTIEPTGVDLCVDCLASRVELGQHRATHKYRLVDNGGLQLLGRCVLSLAWLWQFSEI